MVTSRRGINYHNMRSKLPKTEFALWLETVPEHRSFLVEALHWFHYRPAALKRSWAREETLTWELLRAFEILPQSIFQRPFLEHLATLSPETNRAVAPLLAAGQVTVTKYPSLKLAGLKRNCRSDIGFGLEDGATVWIEAKTAPFNKAELRVQVIQQQKALAKIFPETPIAIITLLPWNIALPGIANIAWSYMADLLKQSVAALRKVLPDEFRAGYEHIALELLGRIRSHPNNIAETLMSRNQKV
jgi:hypothetical protein